MIEGIHAWGVVWGLHSYLCNLLGVACRVQVVKSEAERLLTLDLPIIGSDNV